MNIETICYTTRNKKKLLMDGYMDSLTRRDNPMPVLIYLHGGAFNSGSRVNKLQTFYCNHFAEKGFAVFAIDYRLSLKRASANTQNILKAVKYGVEDLADATAYIYDIAEKWGLDRNKILVSGSGAGAIIALTAEYQICRGGITTLPSGFNFAGIIANAGAVITDTNELEWDEQPCPILLMHGNSDQYIAFNKFFVPGMLWAGSNYLHNQFQQQNIPHWFYEEKGADHIVAIKPLQRQINEMETFVEKFVMMGQRSFVHTVWEDEQPDQMKDITNIAPLYLEGWEKREDIDSLIKEFVEISK